MIIQALCVGGPKDGEIVAVPPDSYDMYVQILDKPFVPKLFRPGDPFEPLPIRKERYILYRFEQNLAVFVHQDLTPDQAFNRLIQCYSGSRSFK